MKRVPHPGFPPAAPESAAETLATSPAAFLEAWSGATESLAARAASSPALTLASPAASSRARGVSADRGTACPGRRVRQAMPKGPGPGSASTDAADPEMPPEMAAEASLQSDAAADMAAAASGDPGVPGLSGEALRGSGPCMIIWNVMPEMLAPVRKIRKPCSD
ncbi:MAG: hypothetical protein LBQ79_12640 [Deltaproteobacteria bacterium]|nr:hypothetical protein [Deltaproteobacteria bacterium]